MKKGKPVEGADKASPETRQTPDLVRATEIAYHRGLNRWIVLMSTPLFVFFSIFHGRLGNALQSVIFALLAANAVIGLFLGWRMQSIAHLVRLKRVSGGIAFGLLAASFTIGVFHDHTFYIFFPWIFIYPFGVMLFFGERIGLLGALLFSWVMVALLLGVALPEWDAWSRYMMRSNAVFALLTVLAMALIAERHRVQVQRKLVAAREEAREAEQHQREANRELQQEIERRTLSEKALAQSEMRYRALFEESAVSLWEEDWSELKRHLDRLPSEDRADLKRYFEAHAEMLLPYYAKTVLTGVNQATVRLFEAPDAATLVSRRGAVLPRDGGRFLAERMAALSAAGHHHTEMVGRTLKGRPLHLLVSSIVPAGFEASWEKVYTSVFDITERVALEEEKMRMVQQLQRGREIQAIATLAGGIAHRFNNALAVIKGNLELLEIKAPRPLDEQRHWEAVWESADRMGRLTDQLLAYARGGKYRPRPFSANQLLQKILNEKALVPGDKEIRLQIALAPTLHDIQGDTTQINMVFEAVLTNAVEAMDKGGRLAIATDNAWVEGREGLADGPYVVVTVEDSGTGMDGETVDRVFEPFYTTKLYGRGLGMAAAYGVVSNHGGKIAVTSQPGSGTRVEIYLPALI